MGHISSGSRGSGPPPPLGHDVGFLTLGPKLDPLLDPPPPFLLVDHLRWTPPPFQKSWIRPCIWHLGINDYIIDHRQARIQDFLQGGSTTAVYLWRPRRRGGGLGLINIRLRYIASIEYSERFIFFFFFAS